MIIDAHAHYWVREMMPNEVIRAYMEPILKLQRQFGEFLDFGLEEEIPMADYHAPISDILGVMDICGIDKTLMLGIDFELLGGTTMSNEGYFDELFDTCSVDERLIPFISVDPNRGEEGLRMLERLVKKHNPVGLKVYPATGFYPDEERYDPYWDMVEDLGLLVLSHAGMALAPMEEKYCRPTHMKRVAEKHPDMNIIIAHMGGKFHEELAPIMREHDNVYTDCSALQGWMPSEPEQVYSRLESICGEFPERVVFGSDFPIYEERFSTYQFINLIRDGDWGSDKLKADLLGGNMARLL